MISFLRGTLQFKKPPLLIVEVNGVGYECHAPMSTFYNLPDVGQSLFIHTHYIVREDSHALYAFFHEQERTLFRSLIKVSNVGPKLALTILSGLEPQHFVKYVLNNDVNALTHIPGVGKKTAERLIIEMRDRVHDWSLNPLQEEIQGVTAKSEKNLMQDAVSALVALGFKPQEASRAIAKVDNEYQTAEELIRLALQSTLKGAKNDNSGSPN